MEENEFTHSVAITLLIDFPLIQESLIRWVECFDDPEDDITSFETINLSAIDFASFEIQQALIYTANAIDAFAQSKQGEVIDVALPTIVEFVAYNAGYGYAESERLAEILVSLLLDCILPEQLDRCFHKPVLLDTNMGIKHVSYVLNKGILFSVVVNW